MALRLMCLLDRLQRFAQFFQFCDRKIEMLIALRLIVLELPESLEDGQQLFLVCHGQIICGVLDCSFVTSQKESSRACN